MNSKITAILIAFLVLLSIGGSASAATLNLVTKNTATWDHAGNGLVNLYYNEEGTMFVYSLNGVVTLPNTEYTLMYYVDKKPTGTPESFVNPGVVGQVITTVTSDADKKVATSGEVDILSMPFAIDPNGEVGANSENPGAKVWLVPSADVVDGINWANMGNFLYEENLGGAVNGVPSHLILYTKIGDGSASGEGIVGVCVEPTVGIAIPDTVSYGKLYAGETTTADLEVIVTEYVSDMGCGTKIVPVTINVDLGAWSNLGITSPVVESISSEVETEIVKSFVLSANVGADVPAGSYTQTITVEAVY